jgi:subtilisin family serine protease
LPSCASGRRPTPTRRCAAAATLALLLAAAAARAQERPLGPAVRAVAALSGRDRARLLGDTAAARRLGVTRGSDGEPVVQLFVRLRSPDVTPLASDGARVGTRAGTLVSARIPLAALHRLLADDAVAAVYGSSRLATLNDVGTGLIGVAGLRQLVGTDDFSGPVGRGVIIGLVDTGLDFTHEDFLVDSLGRSRVLYLWDQTLSGPGPGTVGAADFSYGVECRQEDLTTIGCPSRDTDGHGTHVLGTAAGDGSGTGGAPAGQYAGVAPGADLIVVKTTQISAAIVDGVNYIFRRAEQLGRPAVVNVSLGNQFGPHDGTLPEEVMLDSLVGPGRIVVAAAGNDGDNGNATPPVGTSHLHAQATLSAPDSVSFTLSVPAYTPLAGAGNDYVELQLWYAASDTVSVAVIRPDGSSASIGATGAGSVTQDGAQGQIRLENGRGCAVALSPDNVACIELGDLNGGAAVQGGLWTIRVSSLASHSGQPAHLWLARGTLGSGPNNGAFAGATLGTHTTNSFLITEPATATRVLAVGAYVSRLSWVDVTGQTESYLARFGNQERLGDLVSNSSPGPRRDGVLKPDITAPGKGVASSLSRFATVAAARTLSDGRHWINEGTSMATPFVTGSVALLLERRPDLTPEDVRALLTANALTDSFTVHAFDGSLGGTPNASWGYGKLFVPTALGTLVQLAALRPGRASDAIGGRVVPSGAFRVLHLLVIGDPDSTTVLDSLAVTTAGSVDAAAVLGSLSVYRDVARSGVVPAGAPLLTAALSPSDPRVMLRLGPDTIARGDTIAFVVTTRLDSGVAVPSGRTLRLDVASGGDVFLRTRSGRPVAVQGIPFRGPTVTLQGEGELTIRALPLGNTGVPVSSARDSSFTVLRVELAAGPDEPVAVQQFGVAATGVDPAAVLRVVLDSNRNGVADAAEAVLAESTAALRSDSAVLLAFAPPSLTLQPGASAQLLMAVRTSGAAPNGAEFSGAVALSRVHTLSLYSGLADHYAVTGPLTSGTVTTSLLAAGEGFNLSENPVRGSSVIINYAGAPRRVGIYSFTGVLIREFAAPPSGRVVWDLTNDDGRPVVNGVYVVVVVGPGATVIRHRLYVARRGGGGP